MYLKNNSDTTYCSEVEYMLKASTVATKTVGTNVSLRRSQRLSQKLKGGSQFSQNIVDAAKGLKPISLTQDIFRTCDLEVNKKIGCREITKQFFNSTRHICVPSGLPIDLSKKTKVPTLRTDESCNIKTVLGVTKDYITTANESEQRFLHLNKSKHTKNHVKGSPKSIPILGKKSASTKTVKKESANALNSLKDVNQSENISFNINIICKPTGKRGQPFTENSSLVKGKRIKLSNKHNCNLAGSEILTIKPQKRFLPKSQARQTRKSSKQTGTKKSPVPSSKNSTKGLATASDNIKGINQFDNNVTSDNKNIYKNNYKSRQTVNKNLELYPDKGMEYLKKHANINKRKNQTKLSKLENLKQASFSKNKRTFSHKNSPNIVVLKDKLVKSESKLELKHEVKETRKENNELSCNKTRVITRSQKAVGQSDQSILVTKNESKEFLQEKSIKSEPPTSQSNKNITSATNKWQDISSEMKNEASTFGLKIFPKVSGEVSCNKILGSAANAITNEKLSSGSTTSVKYNDDKFGCECSKVKIELLSEKSIESKYQRKKSKNICKTKNTSKKLSPYTSQQRLNSAELKILNLNPESQLNTHNGIMVFCESKKPIYSIQKINQTDRNNKSEMTMLNKNYLQSFDRNQFLDKIQKARNYVDNLPIEHNNCNQLKNFEVPPTPAESSEDFVKGSILPDIYPSHFKHQLPPEEVFVRSLDPTCVITHDDTSSLQLLESSSTSPSLPESICELFHTKDIKDILNIGKSSYRLFNYHIQALALILNLRFEYLCRLLDKITNISPNVLKSIQKATKMPFVPDSDIFGTSADELCGSNGIIFNSQSPKQR